MKNPKGIHEETPWENPVKISSRKLWNVLEEFLKKSVNEDVEGIPRGIRTEFPRVEIIKQFKKKFVIEFLKNPWIVFLKWISKTILRKKKVYGNP